MRPYAASVCGLKLLVYAALRCSCMRPYAASVCGLKILVYAALCGGVCECVGDRDDCLIGNYVYYLKLLVYAALRY